MSDLVNQIREACARVAEHARHVRVEAEVIPGYAATLPRQLLRPNPPSPLAAAEREALCAYWLTLDAINFGSGWFPTLRKPPGRSGYATIAGGLSDRFEQRGPWSAAELARIGSAELAPTLGQDPDHELIGLFAESLQDFGSHVRDEHAGSFAGVVDSAGGSAVALAQRLGGWSCFADSSSYDGFAVPFFKRAQIAAADIARARAGRFGDLDRLTMFADNLVPHVLRLDGVLTFADELTARIERGELIEPGAAAEVEIRACALHAVELIVAARPGCSAAELDQLLWQRGQLPRYKAQPRHRSRCTAY
ncbi:MAG: queuosine salvage family protein [Actinomycetota bacterium]|nr:queuosine salvage family protein [Actinomycetota bacterium]